ncbi:hypothetical protein [Xanthomonas sacchari]|uniref:hypothetical protein n=1 Tax=Xanthomonas sacchari TaxID=56458 RepID=UPI0012E06BC1|nr:hypothetical protein [Xanthomonas sacchari]
MDADPERVSAEGARQGVLSFGYFSLHKQRKVTRRQAKALHLEDAAAVAELQERLQPRQTQWIIAVAAEAAPTDILVRQTNFKQRQQQRQQQRL